MSKKVVVVDAQNIGQVSSALSEALWHNGPAVLIRDQHTRELLTEAPPHLEHVPTATALIINTSGTSGTPKTVALSAEGLLSAAHASHNRLGGPGQWILSLPLTFIAGASIVTRSLVAQTQPVVVPVEHFEAEKFIAGVREMTHERQYASVVPVQLSRLIQACKDNSSHRDVLHRLDAILVGGQALDDSLRDEALRLGLRIVTTYGSSETSGGCVYDGVPLDDVDIEIDPVTSEIVVSAPQLALGYIDDDQRTTKIFQNKNNKRWYHTGDTGSLRDGRLEISGRRDRTIISGGLKIDLDHMHTVIAHKYGVVEFSVVYIPDVEWGARPAVVFEKTDELALEKVLQDLPEFVATTLGKAAIPAVVLTVEKLPRTPHGKPDLVAITQLATDHS